MRASNTITDKFEAAFNEQIKKFIPDDVQKTEECKSVISELEKTGKVVRKGDDKYRKIFVNLQAAAEKTFLMLAAEGIINHNEIRHITHTPLPATPLCYTGPDKDIDPHISKNPSCLSTVTSRQQLIMSFLAGGVWLASVYPEEGLAKRTEEGQGRYKQLLAQYPNLKDYPISKEIVPELPNELIGAIAWFITQGITVMYAIGAYQANKQVDEPQTWLFAIGEKDKLSALQECWGSRMSFFDKIGLAKAIPPIDSSFSPTNTQGF